MGATNNAASQNAQAQQQIHQNTQQAQQGFLDYIKNNPFILNSLMPPSGPQQLGGSFGGGNFGGATGGLLPPVQGLPAGTPGINPSAPRMTQPMFHKPETGGAPGAAPGRSPLSSALGSLAPQGAPPPPAPPPPPAGGQQQGLPMGLLALLTGRPLA